MVRYRAFCGESGSDLTGNGKGNSGDGFSNSGPIAWTAPESFEVTEETKFIPIPSPYNPSNVGLAPRARNELESAVEVDKQQGDIKINYWKAFTSGAVAAMPGIGPAISAHYLASIAEGKDSKPVFNSENIGIIPSAQNKKKADKEEDKQGGYDWSLLLPGNWIRTVSEYLAAKAAEEGGAELPLNVAKNLQDAGSSLKKGAEKTAKAGEKVVDVLGGKDDTPFDFLNWMKTDIGMVLVGVAGFVLLLTLIRR